VDLISLRAELLPLQADIDAAADPYALVRDVWLQNREFNIYDGDPPAPDYDSMLEEY
jgi:phospholipid-binding lipoprotein MlaA